MRKVVISGGPHAGKTTLQAAIKERYPWFDYPEEPASVVMNEARATRGEFWTDIFNSPLEFCTLCMVQAVKAEKNLSADVVIFDRSLVDTIAYSRRDGCPELVPILKDLILAAEYNIVLFCQQVGEIADRIENASEADLTRRLLHEAYSEVGIPLVDVPALSVADRLEFVDEYLQA